MRIEVEGWTPAPQGSHRAFAVKKGGRYTGKVVVTQDNKNTDPWRTLVAQRAREALRSNPKISGPCIVSLTFFFMRPASHYGTGKNWGVLKASAPKFHCVKPDVDKLERAVLDALTAAGVYEDDARVVRLVGEKRYGDTAGVVIHVDPIA